MKAFPLYILILSMLSFNLFGKSEPVDYVNAFTGTSNSRWMITPGPCLPFGMVKLSPDNQGNVWNGGYEYTIGSISGFSHLHGMTLSGVSYMPTVGNLYFGEEYAKLFPGVPDGPYHQMWTAGYRSRYQKEEETGSVGYYRVKLYDYDIDVELTATTRCGMMRLTFPESQEAHLLLDLDFPAEELPKILETRVTLESDNEISGYISQFTDYADNYTVYFVSQFSKSIESMDGWQYQKYEGKDTKYGTDWRRKCKIEKGITTFTGKAKSGVVLNWKTEANEQIIIKTGISFVSVENAKLNLERELAPFGWQFDQVVEQAKNTWNALLSRIDVTSENKADVQKFYTNLYRVFTGKTILSDVNGEYVDMCEQVQQLQAPANYIFSGDGFWGAQWELIPLLTLIAPEWANALSNSFLALYENGGWIPEAPTGLEYAPIMGAQHHNALLISSFQKGIANFDIQQAYTALKHDYTTQGIEHPCGGYAGNRHLQVYLDYGYVPEEFGPVSNTLEYAYDDWCLSQLAQALGKREDAKYFYNRSMNYTNIFDPQTGYMRRKHKNGDWVADFDPFREGTEGGWNGPGYMEGNAWIYTWFVPHDLNGLIELLGKDEFNRRLEEGFHKNYVNLGNQPNLQAPFLFNYSGKPWLTQKYSRYVANEFFNLSPLMGWIGEEDEGQMAALFVLLSMGLFEMDGGTYDLSSPLFDQITIHLDNTYYSGKEFIIKTINNSRENMYIQSVTLNGKPLGKPRFRHKDLIQGGELVITLGNEPNKNWGN